MQFKKSAVVGVLIMLYLTTDSCCLYVPEGKPTTKSKPGQIQICGNALTTFVIEFCDGFVGSLNQANVSRNSVQTKITEECCDQECPLDYFQSYCGNTPLFTFKKTLRGKLLSKLTRNRLGVSEGATEKGKKKEKVSEVRTQDKKSGETKKRDKTRKKRKRSFKWKCAYKSFGHYLLKLERKGRARHAKGSNAINRTWPSIEIGTISPDMDKFGGQPIVVVKKNKSKSS